MSAVNYCSTPCGNYKLNASIHYYSKRYKKWICVPSGYLSDGATGAKDLKDSISWWVHDWLCGNWLGSGPKPPVGEWADGSKLTNRMASRVLYDILDEEGYFVRRWTWRVMTYLFGGTKLHTWWRNK